MLLAGALFILEIKWREKQGGLFDVERRPQQRNCEVREVRGVLVELQPANDAMLGEIRGHLRVVDRKVLGHLRTQRSFSFGARATAGASRARELAGADAQCLACLHVVVRHQIRIGEQKNARAGRRVFQFIHSMEWRGDQASEHGFQLRES